MTVSCMKLRNDYVGISTWNCEYSKYFLKSYATMQKVNKTELHDRQLLLKYLIANILEILVSLSKIELRHVCAELKLLDIADISKHETIESMSDAMIKNYGDITNDTLELINEEGRD